ncbi:MAG: hypothetical protein ABIV28_04610 [Longimicrobiales bacterium]
MRHSMTAAALLLIVLAVPVIAQTPATPSITPPSAPPTLVFEREVFDYPIAGRRDPFRPLNSNDTSGPLFTELTITGIVYMADSSRSIATFVDLNQKQYRMRRGDRVGNAMVQFIDKTRVVFSIEEFGMKRQESLMMSQPGQGVNK